MKSFLFVLISLVVLQGSSQLPNHKHENWKLLRFALENDSPENFPAFNEINNNYSAMQNIWMSLKNFVIKIKDQLKTWSDVIKQKILILTENFEKKIDGMKNEFKELVQEALVTGDIIKECLQGDKDKIEIILKDILENVTLCLSSYMTHIHNIDDIHLSPYFNDTLIFNEVKNKFESRLESCNTIENYEQCANEIKNEIIGEIDDLKWSTSQKAFDARTVMDDTMDSIIKCFTEGVLNASSVIADETIKIIHCVKDHKEEILS